MLKKSEWRPEKSGKKTGGSWRLKRTWKVKNKVEAKLKLDGKAD